MDFLSQLLRCIGFVPTLVTAIEGLFGFKPGTDKKDAAMSFLESALSTVDRIAAREITDPAKFSSGLAQIISGTVACLNASAWSKPQPIASASNAPCSAQISLGRLSTQTQGTRLDVSEGKE